MNRESKSQQNKHHKLVQRAKIKKLEKEIKIKEATISILIKALNQQNIKPQFACSCFQDCKCLEKSLKLI